MGEGRVQLSLSAFAVCEAKEQSQNEDIDASYTGPTTDGRKHVFFPRFQLFLASLDASQQEYFFFFSHF